MFGFLADAGNYADRKVDQWISDDNKRMVSTARVSDGAKPFETAFEHPDYDEGKMVIVEAYDTREAAMEGHGRWLKVMIDGPLPDELVDCCNSEVSQIIASMNDDGRLAHKRIPKGGVPAQEHAE